MARTELSFTAVLLAGAMMAMPAAAAQDQPSKSSQNAPQATDQTSAAEQRETMQAGEQTPERSDAKGLIRNASDVVQQMKAEQKLVDLMRQSKGVYIVPNLVKGAFIAGGYGGEGVLLANKGGTWSGPSFYNVGAITVGAQAGGAAGPVVMILMSDDALQSFEEGNNFSLNARAGLSVFDYSAMTEGDFGKGDVVVWSDKAGLFAGANVGISDINVDEDLNQAFYGRDVDLSAILQGNVESTGAESLKKKLPG